MLMKDIKETIKAVEMSIGDTTQVEKEEANMGEEEIKEIKKIGWYKDQRKQFLQINTYLFVSRILIPQNFWIKRRRRKRESQG